MRKGLTVTLMAAAIAMWSYNAMAVAPVIFDIPSPVVGDENGITNADEYVFPDAIDLSQWVSDPDGGPVAIVWSYDILGTPKYNINGVGELAGGNAIVPGSLAISTQVLGGEEDGDANPETITVRNINLSPTVGAPGTDPGPNDASGVVDAETQLVTLYASDGATVTTKDVWFYTESGGFDHLSPLGLKINVYDQQFEGGVDSWTTFTDGGGITQGTAGNTALCIDAALTGNNVGGWAGWLGQLPLVQNNVYHIRAVMNGSAATAGTTPFWDIAVNNYAGVGATPGLNAYGSNYMFLDGAGGANAVLQTTLGQNFDIWWCPPPVLQPDWNQANPTDTTPGPFNPATGANKDGRLIFRVLDAAVNGGITADQDFGSVCLDAVTIDRYDLDNMTVTQADVFNPVSAMGNGDQDVWSVDIIASSATATWSGGVLTLAPTAAGQASMLAFLNPGDKNNDYQTPSSLADNYPVAWNSNEVYEIVMGCSAPNQTSEDQPFDVFWLGADTPTNELVNLSFVTGASWASGMPKQGAAQDYVAFFATNQQTEAVDILNQPIPEYKFWRPRAMFGNNGELFFNANAGSMNIHYVKVHKVSFD